jgi:hypothetical protein
MAKALKTNKTTNTVFSLIGILRVHFSSDFITFVNMTELLTTVIQVAGLTRRKTWFNPPFSWEIPVPSRECDSCFLVSHLVVS